MNGSSSKGAVRSALVETLEQELAGAIDGRGRAVFVVAPPGHATQDKVAAFQELAFRRHAALRVAFVDCVHTTPEDDAWTQFERILTRRYRLRGSARRLAGDWLEVIPILGPLLQAVWVTIQTVLRGESPAGDESGSGPVAGGSVGARARRVTGSGAAHERASDLWTLEPLEPRLMVLENFQQAFPGELAGTSNLLAHLDQTRTLFVAVTRVEGALPPLIDDLILEAERTGRARRVALGAGAPTTSAGSGASVDSSARGTSVGGSASASTPHAELSDLAESDRQLLARAAVEGPVLHPLFLQRLLGVSELELEDIFARLVRRGVLEARELEEVGGESTGAYAFRAIGRRERLLDLLTDEERRELEERADRLRQDVADL